MANKISMVVTFHNEGILANYALQGFIRNRKMAEKNGCETELICVLDRTDVDTKKIVSNHACLRESDHIILVNNGDLASSRNDGIKIASGEFVAIMDGDDYYSTEWLIRAHRQINEFNRDAICHPRWIVGFGRTHHLAKIRDQRKENYPMASLLKHHPWVSCSFARRSIYETYPYAPVHHKETGFAYEDWHWNLETLAHGIFHITAEETALFYRQKAQSMLTQMNSSRGIIRPTKFFDMAADWEKLARNI